MRLLIESEFTAASCIRVFLHLVWCCPLVAHSLDQAMYPVVGRNTTSELLTHPLRVCTASVQDFGARCNGAIDPAFEGAQQPSGEVPSQGWCSGIVDFCGYDIDIFNAVARALGLKEGRHFVRICMGEEGFGAMIDDMSGANRSQARCDIAVSAVTATVEREESGIRFSRPVYQSSLAVLVYAPPKDYGIWAFMRPLDVTVWLALLGTMALTPPLIFFVEAIFSSHSHYLSQRNGTMRILASVMDIAWASVAHVMLMGTIAVTSLPARVILIGYSFLVFTISNTYTASVVAVQTAYRNADLDMSIADLAGAEIGTPPTYAERISALLDLQPVYRSNWDYDSMVDELQQGGVKALVSDDTQLVSRAASDDTCSLRVLSERVLPYDIAFAFRKGFPYPSLVKDIDGSLLTLKQTGYYTAVEALHVPPEQVCRTSDDDDVRRVKLNTLQGVWVIMGLACILSLVVGIGCSLQKKWTSVAAVHGAAQHPRDARSHPSPSSQLTSLPRDIGRANAAVRGHRGRSMSVSEMRSNLTLIRESLSQASISLHQRMQ